MVNSPASRNGTRAALAALLLAATGTLAAAGPLTLKPGMTGVPDLGAIRCATYNAMYPNGPNGLRQATLYWTEGYLYARTGLSLDEFLSGRPDGADWTFESLTDHVLAFCETHAEDRVRAAVDDLWTRLQQE